MLLEPESFAVIGASQDKHKIGHIIFKNLHKKEIPCYPVNPNTKKVLGTKCLKSITELKGLITHAVIAVPAGAVKQVIQECGIAGVKYAIIISAGFSEAGNKQLENETAIIAKHYGIRILGPNVLGIIKPGSYNASFYKGELIEGGISIISQSGALGVAILDKFKQENWGLRTFISVGNTSDLTINDCLKELIQDEKTKTILIYTEALKNGQEFMNLCKESNKPVYILKAGTTSEGSKAANTHTAALAGDDQVYTAAFKQCGAVRVNTLTELMHAGIITEKYGRLGNKALIITNAGGPGILMTDALANKGIQIPKLHEELIKELDAKLEKVHWSRNNPLDLVGDATPERYALTLEAIKEHDFYDYTIILLTPQAVTQPTITAQEIIQYAKTTKKPVITCFLGGNQVKKANTLLKKEGILAFDRIEDITNAIH